jgi:hypothetical protein
MALSSGRVEDAARLLGLSRKGGPRIQRHPDRCDHQAVKHNVTESGTASLIVME